MSESSENTPKNPQNRPQKAARGRGTSGREAARDLAASLVAGGAKIKDAASQAGIGERTLRRWLDEDASFGARVQEIRSEMIDAALGRLSDGMAEASDVLRALLGEGDPDVRHRAAVKLIELGLKVRDHADLEERVRQLEAIVGGGTSDGDTSTNPEAGGEGTGAHVEGAPEAGAVQAGPEPADG